MNMHWKGIGGKLLTLSIVHLEFYQIPGIFRIFFVKDLKNRKCQIAIIDGFCLGFDPKS